MSLLAYFLLRRRLLLAGVIAALSVLALVGASRLKFDDDYTELFRSHDERSRQYERLARVFGGGDADCVVLLEADNMLSRPALAAVLKIHDQTDDLAAVESVVSLYSIRRAKRIGRAFLPLFPPGEADDELFDRARREADQHPLVAGRLLSADHRASLVLVRLRPEVRTVDQIEAALAQIRGVVGTATAGTGVSGRLTGEPAIRTETIRRLEREHLLITAIGAALAALVAWVLLRRIVAVALVVGPAMVGVLWTMGTLGLTGKNLDAINIVLPALVLVIGVADSIHLMFHFREARTLGQEPLAAVLSSLRELGGACALTAVTTAVGFATLAVSQDKILRDFGIYGAIGVTLTFLAVVTLLPLLCSTPLGMACTPRGSDRPHVLHGYWLDAWLDMLAPRAPWLAAGCALAAVATALCAARIHADYSFLENLTDSSESLAAMRRVEEQFGGGPMLQVLVEWPLEGQFRSRETLAVLDEVHDAVEASPAAAAPVSVLSLLQSLPGPPDPFDRFGELRYLRPDRLRPLVREDERLALVTAYAPDAGAAALRGPLDKLDAELRQIETRHPGYRLHLTGLAVVSTYRTTSMIMNLLTGLTLELVIIFGIIALALRSPLLGLVSLPSNVFPMLATAAAVVLLGWPLRYATVLAFNICLGIAVDDTIHFLSRYRRELAVDGDRIAAIRRSFHAVAPVMVTTTILMLTGFGAGLFCTVPTIRAFSACSCLALLLALVSEAVILPCLLFCAARWAAKPLAPVAADHRTETGTH